MTDKEVLETCIQRATKSGWKVEFIAKDCFRVWYMKPCTEFDGAMSTELASTDFQYNSDHPNNLIYNHEFAKSLFNEQKGVDTRTGKPKKVVYPILKQGGVMGYGEYWQFYLQQMVISPDPIDYLRRWLDGRA